MAGKRSSRSFCQNADRWFRMTRRLERCQKTVGQIRSSRSGHTRATIFDAVRIEILVTSIQSRRGLSNTVGNQVISSILGGGRLNDVSHDRQTPNRQAPGFAVRRRSLVA